MEQAITLEPISIEMWRLFGYETDYWALIHYACWMTILLFLTGLACWTYRLYRAYDRPVVNLITGKTRQPRVVSRRERREMNRRKYLNLLVTDGFCDFMEGLRAEGKIDDEELRYYYNLVGSKPGLEDLKPRSLVLTKDLIIKRLKSGFYVNGAKKLDKLNKNLRLRVNTSAFAGAVKKI